MKNSRMMKKRFFCITINMERIFHPIFSIKIMEFLIFISPQHPETILFFISDAFFTIMTMTFECFYFYFNIILIMSYKNHIQTIPHIISLLTSFNFFYLEKNYWMKYFFHEKCPLKVWVRAFFLNSSWQCKNVKLTW